jgi:hypothetical protein
MLDRADDTVISGGFTIVIEVSVFGEASVTEKERVELCADHKIRRRNFASRSGLDESAVSQATDGVRARLRERVKRSAQFTSCAGCYETVVLRARAV